MATNNDSTARPIMLQKMTAPKTPNFPSAVNIALSTTLDLMKADIEPVSKISQGREKQMDNASGSSRCVPSTVMSSSEAREIRQRRITESHCPTIDAVLMGAAHFNPNPEELSKIYAALFGYKNTVSSKKDISAPSVGEADPARIFSPTRTSKPVPSQHKRPQHVRLLQVPGSASEDEDNGDPIRCSKCRWNLLSRPQTKPGVPTVSVTDPAGTVRYPHDHTYYIDDGEDDDDSDLDD